MHLAHPRIPKSLKLSRRRWIRPATWIKQKLQTEQNDQQATKYTKLPINYKLSWLKPATPKDSKVDFFAFSRLLLLHRYCDGPARPVSRVSPFYLTHSLTLSLSCCEGTDLMAGTEETIVTEPNGEDEVLKLGNTFKRACLLNWFQLVTRVENYS